MNIVTLNNYHTFFGLIIKKETFFCTLSATRSNTIIPSQSQRKKHVFASFHRKLLLLYKYIYQKDIQGITHGVSLVFFNASTLYCATKLNLLNQKHTSSCFFCEIDSKTPLGCLSSFGTSIRWYVWDSYETKIDFMKRSRSTSIVIRYI